MREDIKRNANKKNRPQWQIIGAQPEDLIVHPTESLPTPLKTYKTTPSQQDLFTERDDVDFDLSDDDDDEDFTRSNVVDEQGLEELIEDEIEFQEMRDSSADATTQMR